MSWSIPRSSEESAQVPCQLKLVALKLPPRNPDHSPAMSGECAITRAISLKRARRPVERSAVQLDDEPRLRPNTIRFDVHAPDLRVDVAARRRELMPAKEPREDSLELAARDAGAISGVGQDRA
jgi:hypothetical protein